MKLQKVRQNSYKGEVNSLVRNFERLWRMTDKCYEKLALYDDTVEKLNTTASELSDKLDSIEDSVSECSSSISSVNKTLTSYGSRITALENSSGSSYDDSKLVDRIDALESAVSALQDSSGDSYDDSELVDRIDALESAAYDLETQLNTNATNIIALSTNVDNYYNTNARNITILSNTVSTLSDNLDTTNSSVDSIQNSINALGTLYANQVQITSVNNTGAVIVEGGGYCLAQFSIPEGLIMVGVLGFSFDGGSYASLRVKNYFVNNVRYPYIVGCYVENCTDESVSFSAFCYMATLPV